MQNLMFMHFGIYLTTVHLIKYDQIITIYGVHLYLAFSFNFIYTKEGHKWQIAIPI